jgi:hypothetical protein
MKLAIRVAAFTMVVVAAAAGNSLPNNSANQVTHRSAMTASTPVPTCNPFEKSCPPIR